MTIDVTVTGLTLDEALDANAAHLDALIETHVRAMDRAGLDPETCDRELEALLFWRASTLDDLRAWFATWLDTPERVH